MTEQQLKDRIVELATENARLWQALGEFSDGKFWSWVELHLPTANEFHKHAIECIETIIGGSYDLTLKNAKLLENKLAEYLKPDENP